jgi:hypothetical protein
MANDTTVQADDFIVDFKSGEVVSALLETRS